MNDPRVALAETAVTIVAEWSGSARARVAELVVQRWPGGMSNLYNLETRIFWRGEYGLREWMTGLDETELSDALRRRLAVVLRCEESFLKGGDPHQRNLDAEHTPRETYRAPKITKAQQRKIEQNIERFWAGFAQEQRR